MDSTKKEQSKWLVVAILAIIFIAVIYVAHFSNTPISIWAESKGSTEKPVELPSRELVKIVDATGWPVKKAESPTIFLVSLNNQTDWFLTSIKISLYKETSEGVKSGVKYHYVDSAEENSRTYLGTPLSFLIEKGKYDKVRAIPPMSSAHFYFNIGPFLSCEKQGKGYKAKYVFESYKWRIVAANGYKK